MGNIYNKVGGGRKLGTKSITANGTYYAEDDHVGGYSQVTVNVPSLHNITATFTWRTTAGYLISTNLSAYSYVILKCRTSGSGSSYQKNVYIAMPTNSEVVYGGWTCHHNDGSSDMTGNCVVTIHANSNGVYLDSFSNSDTRTAAYQALNFVALYGIK